MKAYFDKELNKVVIDFEGEEIQIPLSRLCNPLSDSFVITGGVFVIDASNELFDI